MASTSFAVGTGGLVTPAASKMTTIGSYLDIRNDGWTKQYLLIKLFGLSKVDYT